MGRNAERQREENRRQEMKKRDERWKARGKGISAGPMN